MRESGDRGTEPVEAVRRVLWIPLQGEAGELAGLRAGLTLPPVLGTPQHFGRPGAVCWRLRVDTVQTGIALRGSSRRALLMRVGVKDADC